MTQLLGWTLLHFLWEGTALALLLYVAVAFTRRTDIRYALGTITLALMLLAPFVTAFVLARQPGDVAAPSDWQATLSGLQLLATSATGVAADKTVNSLRSVDWLGDLVWLWMAGVALFSLRALGGYLVLQRALREGCVPVAAALRERCAALEARLGIRRRIRYLQSSVIEAPAAAGWIRPVVLLPVAVLADLTCEQVEAIIIHELAHIRRFDTLINLFQIAAETVFFYNPAIWWVNRFLRNERELCCDDMVVELSGSRSEYARALALLAELRSEVPLAMAANGGALQQRIRRILSAGTVASASPRGGLVMLGCLCVAAALVSAANLGQGFSRTERLERCSVQTVAAPPVPPAPLAPAMPVVPTVPVVPAAPEFSAVIPPTPPEPPAAPDVDDDQDTPAPTNDHAASYIEGLKAAGINDLNVDRLIAMKVQGITPQYVKEMRAAGMDCSVGQLIAMKVQGIDADYVKRVRAAGWRDISTGQIIAMKVQGVDPAQAAAFKREFGPEDFSLGQMIAFKVQGITPEYVQGLRSAGFRDLSTGQIIAAKVQGITPEFIEKVRQHGFKDLSLHQLIELKVAGIF